MSCSRLRPAQSRSAKPTLAFMRLGAVAANVVARAVARAVYEATALPFADALPSWRDKFTR